MTNKSEYSICKYLPKNIVDEMKQETILSNDDMLEHGFNICSSVNNIKNMNRKNTTIAEKCVGTKCQVELKGCTRYEKKLGSFHTHPGTTNFPSFQDIISLETTKRKFICIGQNKEIRCIPRQTPSSAYNDIFDIDLIRSKRFEEIQDSFKKRYNDCIIRFETLDK